MATEKATALVLRTTDWSETSRIATLWSREFGKVRGLAKGGRRLRSSFENALDLLTLCSIVLLRKSSGGLDLLTEAQVVRRFSGLAANLPSLYGAYYIAELLDSATQENDPHPALFDCTIESLEALNGAGKETGAVTAGLQVMRFEMRLLDELGYSPELNSCAGCGLSVDEKKPVYSAEAGGLVCANCQAAHRDRRPLTEEALAGLRALASASDEWKRAGSCGEMRRVLGQHVSYRLGRRPRMLAYLEGSTRDPGKGS
jgi:DNA repair protein RecO (recombination protein O)